MDHTQYCSVHSHLSSGEQLKTIIADSATFTATQNGEPETRLPTFAACLACFLTVAMKQQRTYLAYILNSADLGRHKVIVTCMAGFNSNLIKENTINPKTIVGVLPLFPDKAESVQIVKRMMNISKRVTEFRNPSHTFAYESINP